MTARSHPGESGCDVLVVGRYFSDLIFTGLPKMPRLGDEVWAAACDLVPGASYIQAVALHRLGLRVVWPCYFGTDLFSQFVREQARREGLDESHFVDYDRSAFSLSVSLSMASERGFVSYMDEVPEPAYPDLIRQLRPSWVFLPHVWMGQKLEAVTQAAHKSNALVLMDCQAHQSQLEDPALRSALQQVDVFAPNLEEALQLSGAGSAEEALAALSGLCPLVVIKLGGDGAIAQQGSRVVRARGIEAVVVDTTGAGDNFNCGFIYGQIRGYSLEDSLRCGNICGGLSTEARGGTASAPTAAVVEARRQAV